MGQNIDGENLRLPVLAIVLETIKMDCQLNSEFVNVFPFKNCAMR